MKKMIPSLMCLFMLFLTCFFTSSYGQNDLSPCAICAQALKQGTKDEFYKETKHALDESINTLYSYNYEFWESYKSSSNHTTSLDAAYSVYSASFGSISNDTQRKETFNKQQSTYVYSRSLSQNDYEKVSQSLVNKVPYNTFSQCVINTCSQGLFTSYEVTGDIIVVTVRWILQGTPNQTTNLSTDAVAANATPINFNFHKGVLLKPNSSISGLFRRIDNRQKVVVTLNFQNFAPQQVVIPKSEFENTTTPVGSIVASTLDYANFCSLNEIPQNGDNSETTWVPADGRNVSGSVYAKRAPNVPDLRGTFIRGLNIFDTANNPPYSEPRQKDPENRTVTNLQMQDVQAHTHPLNEQEHSHSIDVAITNVGGGGTVAYRPLGQGTNSSLTAKPTGISISVQPNNGAETRPTNIAVYYYIKIN